LGYIGEVLYERVGNATQIGGRRQYGVGFATWIGGARPENVCFTIRIWGLEDQKSLSLRGPGAFGGAFWSLGVGG
jgi:hypothetical protein